MNITICGGGNLGHVISGFLSAQPENKVSLLTTQPSEWSPNVEVFDNRGGRFYGNLMRISSLPEDVIPNADIVFICLPGFAIHDVLSSIATHLNSKTWVGTVVSSTGFFFEAMKLFPNTQPLFGFQRVPFISRIVKYGHVAELKGYKDSLSVAIAQFADKEYIRKCLEILFKTPVMLLDSYYEVSLSNSNPLLHTSRLYSMWKEWKPGVAYETNPQFYSDWTIDAAELLIAMDEEFQNLLRTMGLKKESIPPVLDYYDSVDAESLRDKLRSIQAFKGILSPMIINHAGLYEPDFSSRYFTEDFPYGMKYIVETANKYHVVLPKIEKVFNWGVSMINNSF